MENGPLHRRLLAACQALFAKYWFAVDEERLLTAESNQGWVASLYEPDANNQRYHISVEKGRDRHEFWVWPDYTEWSHGAANAFPLVVIIHRITTMVPLPAAGPVFAYHQQGRVLATVGRFENKLQVRSLPGVRLPAPLRSLDAAAFWQLCAAQRLQPTIEHHLATRWIWRATYYEGYQVPGFVQTDILKPGQIRIRAPREPLALPLIEDGSCVTCVLANVRWMHELSNQQAVHEVDHLAGRPPGEGLNGFATELQLLRDGFRVRSIDGFDFARVSDPSYHRQYYHRIWSSQREAYYARHFAANLAQGLSLRNQYMPLIQSFGPQYHLEPRLPSQADIRQGVKQGQVLIHVQVPFVVEYSHFVLVLACVGENFVIYSPSSHDPLFQLWNPETLRRQWIPEYGILSITR